MIGFEEAKIVYDGLKHGYREVASRMQFNRPNKRVSKNKDVCMHLIGHTIPIEYQVGVPMYKNINTQTKNILDKYIDKALNILNEKTKSANQIFLIMSTNWCGQARHTKHLHTILQKDPERCITMSIVIPLYIDPSEVEKHKFYWYYNNDLYPRITYTSQERVERLDINYQELVIDQSHYNCLLFDSARTPHYINNTKNLYLWIVADAVITKDDSIPSSLQVELVK